MARQKEKIHMEMRPGETLIWTDSPCESKDYGRIDWLLIPLSVIGLAASALFTVLLAAWIMNFGFAMAHAVAIVVLVLVGGMSVYGYFFRFMVKRRRKADLIYGVTNHGRVLIRDTAAQRMYALKGRDLRDACITEKDRRGVGTIYLQPKKPGNWLDNTGLDFFGNGIGRRIALFDIQDCEKVLRLIREM